MRQEGRENQKGYSRTDCKGKEYGGRGVKGETIRIDLDMSYKVKSWDRTAEFDNLECLKDGM